LQVFRSAGRGGAEEESHGQAEAQKPGSNPVACVVRPIHALLVHCARTGVKKAGQVLNLARRP
jgi:hypothetical protein